jgi:glycosyltransferase involved in cell wall biosynthesis
MLYTPEELPFVRRVPHGTTAYWVGDEAMSKLDSHRGLRALLGYVDRVLAISPVTFEQASDLFPHKAHRTGTGVTLSRIDAGGATVPPELAAVPGPVVGYAGSLVALRFDVDLFCDTANAMPEATFVLVGPGDHLITDEIRRRTHENVLILGSRPYEALGSYIGAFDVGIVPYKLNDFNLGSDPLKVYEYLALGKPVVSVPLPSVEELGDVVAIARGPEEFAAMIRGALKPDDPVLSRRRRTVAEAHSVERIVDQVAAWLG